MTDDLDTTEEQTEEPVAEAAVEERETRGLLSIVPPTLLGTALGAAIAALDLMRHGVNAAPDLQQAALDGSIVGVLAGASAGVLRWAFFPYKGKGKPALGPVDGDERHDRNGVAHG